ncbi:tannase/feruloyl esterase family alpha/beta hydrolase [Streptomyces sp. NPDC006684]|uniref:tannase/feruloyl esterase family alpha/beta hydrolase n=1 Tax=Streptomyces sp. NPDC006684 TaxID=3154477 RepID=UPI003454A7DA
MMKRILAVLATVLPLTAAVYLPPASAATPPGAAAPRCAAPPLRAPAGTRVESVTAESVAAGDVVVPPIPPQDGYTVPGVPARCEVTVTLTHPGADDHARIQVWLPASGWNGRLQTVGGSAYAAGDYGGQLAAAVQGGYAAATTDAGVSTYTDVSWALTAKGAINRPLLENFASRSEHETAVLAKQVVSGAYGRPAAHAYFNGCSTGGRQGYMEAQRHPDDYDGIAAHAPAISWDAFEVATLWPQVVMAQSHTYPTKCEFDAFTAAAVTACDLTDGAKDGVIGDPAACDYDPRRLIGTRIDCDGVPTTITAADAAVVREIWDGPRSGRGTKLWYGTPVGADLSALAGVEDGIAQPFPVPAAWVTTFVRKHPAEDATKLSYAEFEKAFRQSRAEFGGVIGTDDPDLSGFRRSGGKLLSWQGLADQYIPAAGTAAYRDRVEDRMGGAGRVDDFYRLFLAPGTDHCAGPGNTGAAPTDPLGALVDWVEHGKAPDTLPAAATRADGRTVTRDLCRYPRVSRYTGRGDVDEASSFRCVLPRR